MPARKLHQPQRIYGKDNHQEIAICSRFKSCRELKSFLLIWRPMIMTNPNTGARTVEMAFYSIRRNSQDGYLVALDGEKLPDGFMFYYHEDHW